jgi:LPXTG-motif cell wall-anchored protein
VRFLRVFTTTQTVSRPSASIEDMDTNTLLIILVVLLVLGGSGFFYRGRRVRR